MGKTRIIVTCPVTDIAVITNLAYEEIAKPRETPLLFRCPCGETHRLHFAGRHGDVSHQPSPPRDRQGAG